MQIHKLHLVIAGMILSAITIKAEITNFEVTHIFKSASSSYRIMGDYNANDSTDVFSTVNVSLQWPAKFGDNNISALQDTILSRAFDVEARDVDTALKQYLARPLTEDEQVQVVADVPDPDNYDKQIYTYSREVDVSTVGFNERYIIYRCFYYEDGFGAHANYYTTFINYDIKENRVITFNDLFNAERHEQLLEIVTQHLLDKYYASSIEDLEAKSNIFVDYLDVSRHFYINGDEIAFYYNPYEIGPWAIGSIDVRVPIWKLRGCLTDYGIQLFYRQ